MSVQCATPHQSSMATTVEQMQLQQAAIAADRTYMSAVGAAESQKTNDIYFYADAENHPCEYFLQPQNLTVPYYVAPVYESYVPPGGSSISHMAPQIKRMKKRGCCC
ncbi:hypothetical protein CSUI_005625 [Cystoisospora suis]|uniref:Uncharacterized protein n=1 Tax=Cystoisospora suis TaxID=483139 RepID=A0A2C6K512_9APIC|nr:hypothetical protein CSUI_005625 [Cystoisospora suis]